MSTLARQLFAGTSNERVKIQRLRSYFTTGGFEPTYRGAGDPAGDPQDTSLSGVSPIERFLFETRAGHCELFAAATALLLRQGGVPTRLVSGFRLTRSAGAGAPLTLRTSDAHAWAEAWIPGQGWLPLDLTPRISAPGSWTGWFIDSYDRLSAYWYRYVVTFDEQSQNDLGASAVREWTGGSSENLGRWSSRIRKAISSRLDRVAFALVGLTILGAAVAWALRAFGQGHPLWASWRILRAARRERRDWIRARVRMGRWLTRRLGARPGSDLRGALPAARERWGTEPARELERWIELYEAGRFGPREGGLDELSRAERSIKERTT
jgi:hypothetical protein